MFTVYNATMFIYPTMQGSPYLSKADKASYLQVTGYSSLQKDRNK